MTLIHKLPFQEELTAIAVQVGDLRAVVNPDSHLGQTLDQIEALLDPHVGSVEWILPVTAEEIDFRRSLQGMKL